MNHISSLVFLQVNLMHYQLFFFQKKPSLETSFAVLREYSRSELVLSEEGREGEGLFFLGDCLEVH